MTPDLRDFKLAFTGAGTEEKSLSVAGNFIMLAEATDPVYVSFDSGPWVKLRETESRISPYSDFRVKCSTAQNVRIVAGFGEMRSGAQTISVSATVSGIGAGDTLTASGDVTVPATSSTLVLAANANRRRAWVQSSNDNDPTIFARVGPSSVGAASGLELVAGQGLPPIENTQAIYVYNPGATSIVICVMEDSHT